VETDPDFRQQQLVPRRHEVTARCPTVIASPLGHAVYAATLRSKLRCGPANSSLSWRSPQCRSPLQARSRSRRCAVRLRCERPAHPYADVRTNRAHRASRRSLRGPPIVGISLHRVRHNPQTTTPGRRKPRSGNVARPLLEFQLSQNCSPRRTASRRDRRSRELAPRASAPPPPKRLAIAHCRSRPQTRCGGDKPFADHHERMRLAGQWCVQ